MCTFFFFLWMRSRTNIFSPGGGKEWVTPHLSQQTDDGGEFLLHRSAGQLSKRKHLEVGGGGRFTGNRMHLDSDW